MMTNTSLCMHLAALSTTALCGIHALSPLPGTALPSAEYYSLNTEGIEIANLETIASRPDNSSDNGSSQPPGSSRR